MFWNRHRLRRPRPTPPGYPLAAPTPLASVGANAFAAARAAQHAQDAISAVDIEYETRPLCECGQLAAFVALVHELDACEPTEDGECEDLTPDGADVNVLCRACLQLLTEAIAEDIRKRQSRLPAGVRLACKTCGRPIAELHDMLETEAI